LWTARAAWCASALVVARMLPARRDVPSSGPAHSDGTSPIGSFPRNRPVHLAHLRQWATTARRWIPRHAVLTWRETRSCKAEDLVPPHLVTSRCRREPKPERPAGTRQAGRVQPVLGHEDRSGEPIAPRRLPSSPGRRRHFWARSTRLRLPRTVPPRTSSPDGRPPIGPRRRRLELGGHPDEDVLVTVRRDELHADG
jgi:hypothetical protein